MKRQSGSKDVPAAWDSALAAVRALSVATNRLVASVESPDELIASALQDPAQRRATLHLLLNLDPTIVLPVLDVLVPLALNDRDAVLVRQVLGRLRHADLSSRLPPSVWPHLEDGDDHDWRRSAELLDHLGLFDALNQLCDRAMVSQDAGVQEVGKDFRR